jgi:hypothetical protein
VNIARRLPRAATLLLHLLVAALAPLADARVELAGRPLGVHVESESRASCPPGHDHLHCQLCRQIESSLTGTCGVQHSFEDVVVRASDISPDYAPAAHAFHGLPLGSRAPPLA